MPWRRSRAQTTPSVMRRQLVIVDDDPTILRLLSVTLGAGLGADVATFHSGPSALEAWPTLPRVEVLVTDLTMPEMSGFELAQKVRALQPNLPCIVLSAVDSRIEVPAFISAMLVKPCPLRTLINTIEGALENASVLPSPAVDPPADPMGPLRERYRAHLADQRPRFEELLAGAGTPDGAATLRNALHQLAGTSGTYGMTELMSAALEVRSTLVRGGAAAGPGRALLACLEREAKGA
jgi:two-component system, NarL family, capsular synthesis sensor histidine kinase RcsC